MAKVKILIGGLIAFTAIAPIQIAASEWVPPVRRAQLVVGLTIEGLHTDRMERYAELYGEHGLRRLLREGRQYEAADYAFHSPDPASAIATIYTGAMPRIHGIVGETVFNAYRTRSIAEDSAYMGNYTRLSSSPRMLMCGTVGDELRDTYGEQSLVYSIAPRREQAIMAGGQYATAALWLDTETAMWCSSTYYGTFPYFATAFNLQNGSDRTATALGMQFSEFARSSYVNDEINRLLPSVFDKTNLCKDDATDLLNITFTMPMPASANEEQNEYVKLDAAIAALVKLLEQRVGKDNVLLFVASMPHHIPAPASAYTVKRGEFHLERCKALLNMYLMALYGQGQWVEDYNGLQIYLNRRLIEENKLSRREVEEECADFLIQMSGVREVYTSFDILQSVGNARYRNAYYRGRNGDLWLEILPSWTIIDSKYPDNNYISRGDATPALLLFWGAQVAAAKIDLPVTIDRVAPTISKAIQIRAPNGCTAMPLSLNH